MALPSALYGRVSHFMAGTSVPLGAAVVYCVKADLGPFEQGDADAIHDAFANAFTPQISNGVSITETRLKVGPDDTGVTFVHAEVDNGALSGAAASSNCSFLIHKVTAGGGRRGKGRMFLPGVLEADIGSDGILTGARQSALQAAANTWVTSLGDIAVGLGFMDLYLEHEPSTEWVLVDGQPRRSPIGDAPDPTPVTNVVVDSKIATQRKRMRR